MLREIISSVLKLPNLKKCDRTYKLGADGNSIQMFTALMLQLIQSCTTLPGSENEISNLFTLNEVYSALLL